MPEQINRRLTTILAADVVGYSRLMGSDEAGVLSALRSLRSEVFDPTIARHNGRIVKLMGDGTLVEFGSVVDAVTCAVEIQLALRDRNAGLPQEKRLELRIGINIGDVMVEGDDLYGDGVNVAARLEGLADPGGICVSEDVVRQASGKVEVGFEDLGDQHLKNIETPVRAYRVVAAGAGTAVSAKPARKRPLWTMAAAAGFALVILSGASWYAFAPSEAPAINVDEVLTIKGPAIAALPLVNLGGDPAHEDFAKGMSEQLSSALTRFNGVRVLSPRASAKYADDLAALRRELGADYLLEGSIRRDSERIRVTAILTKVPSGDQIWTDTFDAEVSPETILDAEERLAGLIAVAVGDDSRGIVALDRVADSVNRAPGDQQSLDCVVAGGTWRSEEGMRSAYQCLIAALERDPTYATGWARLTALYVDSYLDGPDLSDDPGYDPQRLMLETARKAVDLAPNSSEAHYALAEAFYYNDEQQQFLAETAKVLELNPNNAGTIAWLGTLMAFSGHWDEGGALVEKALAFNPSVVGASSWYALSKAHYERGEYAEALEDFQPTWTAYPGYWINDLNRAYLYADWGKQEKAEAAAAALLEQLPDFVVEDAADFYRKLRFQESYIDKMVAALKKAGLPSREDGT